MFLPGQDRNSRLEHKYSIATLYNLAPIINLPPPCTGSHRTPIQMRTLIRSVLVKGCSDTDSNDSKDPEWSETERKGRSRYRLLLCFVMVWIYLYPSRRSSFQIKPWFTAHTCPCNAGYLKDRDVRGRKSLLYVLPCLHYILRYTKMTPGRLLSREPIHLPVLYLWFVHIDKSKVVTTRVSRKCLYIYIYALTCLHTKKRNRTYK